MTKPWIHVLLISVFPALILYANNLDEAAWSSALVPGLVLLGLGAVVWLFLFAIIRDAVRAGLFVSVFMLLSFGFGHILNQFESPVASTIGLVVWAVAILLTLAGVFALKRVTPLTRALNVAACILVGFSLLRIGVWAIQHRGIEAAVPLTIPQAEMAEADKASRPDIYFIILDRYASAESLNRDFDFDNSSFLGELEGEGFSVTADAHSNYPITLYSLASTLNMEHATALTDQYGRDTSSRSPLYDLLEHHRVGRYLKSLGYTYDHVGSWWGPTRENPEADIYLSLITPSDFAMITYEKSVFATIAEKFNIDSEFFSQLLKGPSHFAHARHEFDVLTDVSHNPNPTFTFAHILLPHRPYVFSPDGQYLLPETTDQRTSRENYLNQLQYANIRTLEVMRAIIANSATPPVIILQSDEGPYPARFGHVDEDRLTLRFSDATDEELQMKTGILSALYLPPDLRGKMAAPATPINTFRTLFSLLFGADLPSLPERTYVFSDTDHAYDFIDVTDRLNNLPAECSSQSGCQIPVVEN